jgi:hypothetical protein
MLTDGRRAIIDFKRKGSYFSQHVQIGGYACQIEQNGLFSPDGDSCYPKVIVDSVIVFPNAGKPRTEPAAPFMQRFAEVVSIYKHQQEYDSK